MTAASWETPRLGFPAVVDDKSGSLWHVHGRHAFGGGPVALGTGLSASSTGTTKLSKRFFRMGSRDLLRLCMPKQRNSLGCGIATCEDESTIDNAPSSRTVVSVPRRRTSTNQTSTRRPPNLALPPRGGGGQFVILFGGSLLHSLCYTFCFSAYQQCISNVSTVYQYSRTFAFLIRLYQVVAVRVVAARVVVARVEMARAVVRVW